MGKNTIIRSLFFTVTLFFLFLPGMGEAGTVKISIFNFRAASLDASGYGTTVTNLLMNSLMADPDFFILDRKELEAFLSLNELQQNDNQDNVINIGNRLGLDAIVVGAVEKKGSILQISSKVFSIAQKKVVLSHQVRALGDARLESEINALDKVIRAAIKNISSKQEEKTAFKCPVVNIQKRSGNRRIQLNWEDAVNTKSSTYEMFRATTKDGPFAKIAQVNSAEFSDQNVENNIVYYYKIRGYNDKGLPSEFCDIFSAETALTPNPPVILKTESHVKSIHLVWTPSPIASGDPSRLRGYRLYRSDSEQGPYKEVTNVFVKDQDIGLNTPSSNPDKLLKENYLDKGFADGENYYYKLTAYNEKNAESEFSSAVKGSTLPIIAAPEIQGGMIREVRLAWTRLNASDIKGYYVYRSTNPDTGWSKIKAIDAQDNSAEKKIQYKDVDGLADNVLYYYRISVFESADLETSPSASVSALTKGIPPMPEGLMATSGLVKMAELKWKASAAEDVEGYNIYSARSSEGEFKLIKKVEGRNNTKYTDAGRDGNKLEDNGAYYYRMTSYNKVNVESLQTPSSTATTKPRPAKPVGLTAENGKVKECPLSWKANPEADISYFHVFRNANPGSNEYTHVAKVKGKTEYLDKELKDGSTYSYTLQAEDRDGLLSYLSESTTITTKPRPHSPSGVSGDLHDNMFQLTWGQVPETDIAYYSVYEKKFFGNEKLITTKETKFSEAALPKGKSKTYVVTATDKDNLESEPSLEITLTGK